MNKLIFFFFYICSTFISAQSILLGQWYLDSVKKFDGSSLEINHPFFSYYAELRFNRVKVFVSTSNNDDMIVNTIYRFDGKNLNYFGRNFEVRKVDNFLLLISHDERLVYYYLKGEDFQINTISKDSLLIVENDSVVQRSIKYNPYFDNNKENFTDFLRHNMPNYENELKRIYFKSTFVLTTKNEIKNVKIEKGKTTTFDKEFIEALMKSEKFWKNPTKKAVLITREYYFRRFGDEKKNELKAQKYFSLGENFYEKNDFEKAIENYLISIALEKKDAEENAYKEPLKLNENYKKLGISYLALNKKLEACDSFHKAGGISNFGVRNYIINFCSQH